MVKNITFGEKATVLAKKHGNFDTIWLKLMVKRFFTETLRRCYGHCVFSRNLSANRIAYHLNVYSTLLDVIDNSAPATT